MITKEYTITSPQGIHARPATALIRLTKNFTSAISIKKGDKIVRLNSMLNLLSLAIKGGESIIILIDGADEMSATVVIDQFFKEHLKDL
jgi:phosphocarrier protein HPr